MSLGSIGNSSNTGYLYIKTLQQTQTKKSSGTKTGEETAASALYGSALTQDTVEFSDEAYARYNASIAPTDSTSGTGGTDRITDALDSLVSSGAITSEQETMIASALKPPEKPEEDSSTGRTDEDNPLKKALDSLVSSGTITSDQETAIASALKPPEKPDEDASASAAANSGNPLKKALDALVTNGTITSEQLSSIVSAITPESE